MSTPFSFAIRNVSSVVSDGELASAVPALQQQISSDFAPAWGLDATLSFYPASTPAPADAWMILVADNSDQAGALGYHDLTATGLPLGKVFAKTDQLYQSHWTVTFSHEMLEMLADPNINLTAFDEEHARLYAYEVCDAVEADQFGYQIAGVLVSDFVYPGWFEPFAVPGARYDHQQMLSEPFQLLPGGYIGYFDIRRGSGWQQLTAQLKQPVGQLATSSVGPASYQARAHVGSRRERRRTPKGHWLRSTAH